MRFAGNLQPCAGQACAGGCEAAVHAYRLLIHYSWLMHSLNRRVFLHNISYVCPPMAIYIRNCYSEPFHLFVLGRTEMLSSDGTTQVDPVAMPAYAIGITPLLELIKPHATETDVSMKRVAFAYDLRGGGDLITLRRWWDNNVLHGPKLGYNPKAAKSWLGK